MLRKKQTLKGLLVSIAWIAVLHFVFKVPLETFYRISLFIVPASAVLYISLQILVKFNLIDLRKAQEEHNKKVTIARSDKWIGLWLLIGFLGFFSSLALFTGVFLNRVSDKDFLVAIDLDMARTYSWLFPYIFYPLWTFIAFYGHLSIKRLASRRVSYFVSIFIILLFTWVFYFLPQDAERIVPLFFSISIGICWLHFSIIKSHLKLEQSRLKLEGT